MICNIHKFREKLKAGPVWVDGGCAGALIEWTKQVCLGWGITVGPAKTTSICRQ
jgi:hypothetical protein